MLYLLIQDRTTELEAIKKILKEQSYLKKS